MRSVQANNPTKSHERLNVGQYFTVAQGTGGGKLRFKGTRVSVHTVLTLLAKGYTFKQILARWPLLQRKAIAEAVRLAAAALVLQSGARPWSPDDPACSILLNGKTIPDRKPDKRKKPVRVGKYLIVHPNVCFGRLTFDPTRVPVEVVMAYLAKGQTIERLMAGWPRVTREAITEAIELAAAALAERYNNQAEADNEPTYIGRIANAEIEEGGGCHEVGRGKQSSEVPEA
jgi:uncharacterized protein (DUF433 family)